MNEQSANKMNDPERRIPILNHRSTFLLSGSVALGILIDVLFFDKRFGISYPIFVAFFYGLFFWCLRSRLRKDPSFAWFLLLPVAMLALTYLLFSSPVFYALNFLAVPILVVMQTTLVTRRAAEKWYSIRFIADMLYGFFYRPFAYMALPFIIVGRRVSAGIGFKKDSVFLKVLLGILITIPLLMVIVSLLATADEVFGQLVERLPSLFEMIPIDTFLPKLIIATAGAVLSFSYIWSLIVPKKSSRMEWQRYVRPAGQLDPVIPVTVLGAMNLVYLLFTFIQFTYLFGSFLFTLPENLTYAEYARRGFFELVAVTLINFSVLLFTLYFTKARGRTVGRTLRLMQSLLVICTLVILLSAFVRMYLYEQMYGYTYLRVLTHAFMIFLFVLFLFTFWRIWKKDVRLFQYYLLTAIVAFVCINYLNVDALIARENIDRYHETGKIDIGYLSSLSDDAVPAMTELLGAKDETVSGKMENVLFERKQALENQAWQSFNISRYRAKKALEPYDLHYDENYRFIPEIDGEP